MTISKFSILNLVNDYLISSAKTVTRNNTFFHPSEWSGCHRKIVYQYYEATGSIKIDHSAIKIDPRGQRIFSNGHWMHTRWRSYLEHSKVNILGKWKCQNMVHKEPMIYGNKEKHGLEKPEACECGSKEFEYIEIGYFDEETHWSGHVDAIIKTSIEDYPPLILIDFKTMNPIEFKGLQEPKIAHKTQMQIYLYLANLPLGKFLYENKADQSVKEFDMLRDDAFIKVIKEDAILLKYRVTHKNSKGQNVLPPRAFLSKGHRDCMQCRFRGHCWK